VDPDLSTAWLHNFNGHAAVVQNLSASFIENKSTSFFLSVGELFARMIFYLSNSKT
jgi:hypothetical protein